MSSQVLILIFLRFLSNILLFSFGSPIRVLHPAFEEDELLLIVVGGILGMIAGALQILIFYS